MLQHMELLLNILLVIKSFGMEMEVKHGSSNLNCHMELPRRIMPTKELLDIESEQTLQLIVLTELEPILISEIIKLQSQTVLKLQMHQVLYLPMLSLSSFTVVQMRALKL